MSIKKSGLFSNLASDIPAGLVVFLVALPLCLGIALASEAPLFSGIIAGIIGGIVIGMASGSHLSVSGPAAGLATIVAASIEELGSFEAFTLAVVLAGIMQLTLGFLRAGIIGHYFPSAVIKGMLAGIGVLLILKQIPHALGDDQNYEGEEAFFQPDGENTFTEIILAVQNISNGALIISVISLGLLILWQQDFFKKLPFTKIIPGPLVVVLLGVVLNMTLFRGNNGLYLEDDHVVNLPILKGTEELGSLIRFPDFSFIGKWSVWVTAITIAIVASLETLLSLDAVDKLDPYKRIAPPNRELKAQGLGNLISGLIGGLPITAVIVRSSANVSSGAKSKFSAIFHGFLLLSSVLFFAKYLNLIPKASLAAILLLVGYKLMSPKLIKSMWNKGFSQFVPFVVTIVAIVATDLLKGIAIGIAVGVIFVMRTNMRQAITLKETSEDRSDFILKVNKDASFLNKASIRNKLRNLPNNSHVTIDLTNANFIDNDVIETIEDFRYTAELKNISLDFIGTEDMDVHEKMRELATV